LVSEALDSQQMISATTGQNSGAYTQMDPFHEKVQVHHCLKISPIYLHVFSVSLHWQDHPVAL